MKENPSTNLRGKPHNSINNKEMEQKIEMLQEQMQRVLDYSLLAAKKVLNFSDVALLTGISRSHLYRLTCTHQIPYYKPTGKLVYFDRAEIEAWMKQNRQNTVAEAGQMAAAYTVRHEKKGGRR